MSEKRRKKVFFVPFPFIGMGIGFILDSFLSVERHEIKVQTPVKVGSFVMMIIGVLFMIEGLSTIIAPQLLNRLMPYLVGIGFILGGIFVFMSGFKTFKSGFKPG